MIQFGKERSRKRDRCLKACRRKIRGRKGGEGNDKEKKGSKGEQQPIWQIRSQGVREDV